MVEYATPVLSLYEMSNSKEAGLSSHERLQQMNTFVSTLTAIIDSNPDTKNYCSLVVYNGKSNSNLYYMASKLTLIIAMTV